eukprot:jgi/Botrbrau1/11027/Bobra.101_1s0025.1
MSSCIGATPASCKMSLMRSSRCLKQLKPSLDLARAMPRTLAQATNGLQENSTTSQKLPLDPSSQPGSAVANRPSRQAVYLAPSSASPFAGLVPRRINSLFREMEEELNAMSRSVWGDVNRDFLSGSVTPAPKVGASLGATDVKETDKGYELHVDVPGLTKDDVKVALDKNGVLTISGERQTVTEENKDNFQRVERVYGTFTRR